MHTSQEYTLETLPPYSIHPINEAVAEIDQGEDPWFCLNSFFHDWWHYAIDYRLALISQMPLPTQTAEGKRWAALCAACVEELCCRASLPSPEWINRPEYFLDEPWYYFADSYQKDYGLSTVPETFRKRNVFISDTIFDNKYELHKIFGSKPKWEVWSDEELQKLAAIGPDDPAPPSS